MERHIRKHDVKERAFSNVERFFRCIFAGKLATENLTLNNSNQCGDCLENFFLLSISTSRRVYQKSINFSLFPLVVVLRHKYDNSRRCLRTQHTDSSGAAAGGEWMKRHYGYMSGKLRTAREWWKFHYTTFRGSGFAIKLWEVWDQSCSFVEMFRNVEMFWKAWNKILLFSVINKR